jgi:hypothetical protein
MATDRRVLRSQQNQILDLVRTARLEPREFRWVKTASRFDDSVIVDGLVHEPTQFRFAFEWMDGRMASGHYAIFSPGQSQFEQTEFPGGWNEQLGYVVKWLDCLKREMDAPPLWEQLAAGEPMLSMPWLGGVDSPFLPQEVEAIAVRLTEVRAYLQTELPTGAMVAVSESLDRLEHASQSQGRISWAQMAIGAFIGMVWAGLMPPDQARAALTLIGDAFRRLLN